jgi:hypothetical protein
VNRTGDGSDSSSNLSVGAGDDVSRHACRAETRCGLDVDLATFLSEGDSRGR